MTMRTPGMILLVLAGLCFSLTAQDSSKDPDEQWEKIRSAAETRYELVILKVEKEEFDEALRTAEEIFSLPFPTEKHSLLFDSAKEISDALIHHNQHESAVQVLNFCLEKVTVREIHVELHKEMAYVYKKMGNDAKAMLHFEKALQLSQEQPQ